MLAAARIGGLRFGVNSSQKSQIDEILAQEAEVEHSKLKKSIKTATELEVKSSEHSSSELSDDHAEDPFARPPRQPESSEEDSEEVEKPTESLRSTGINGNFGPMKATGKFNTKL